MDLTPYSTRKTRPDRTDTIRKQRLNNLLSMVSSKDSRFFSLPSEIRNEIYDYCVVVPVSGLAIRFPLAKGKQQDGKVKQTTDLCRCLWSVNKQMYSEVLVNFLQHNHIHWHGNLTTTALGSFERIALPHVRKLSLSIPDYQLCWMHESQLRRLLARMHTRSKLAQDPPGGFWNLRELSLVTRNSYEDLEDDDQIWYHWKTVADYHAAVGVNAEPLPRIVGLKKLEVVAPWEMEKDWKKKFMDEVADGCTVEFGNNHDAEAQKPRQGLWENRTGR